MEKQSEERKNVQKCEASSIHPRLKVQITGTVLWTGSADAPSAYL